MAKVPITEQPIHVYTCLTDPTRKPIAMISNHPMIFKGDTPMKAKKAADDWRKAEYAKITSKKKAAE